MLVDNTHIIQCSMVQSAHVFPRQRQVNMVGAYFEHEIQKGKAEGNSGGFRACTPHELDLSGESLPTVWPWWCSPELSTSHMTECTIGSSAMPSNIRWGQWPSPHPTAVSSEKKRPFQERVGTSYAGTGNPTEWQRAALQQLLCLKCKMWMCLEEVPASITVCKYSLWRRASPVSHSSVPWSS